MEVIKQLKQDRKRMKKIHERMRLAIQILFFVWIPQVYTAAFAGAKYIFTQIGLKSALSLTPFLSLLIVICLYTILFGRFFCGFACAFGSLGDWLHGIYLAICKKRKMRPFAMPAKAGEMLTYLKYVVLLAILLLCFLGKYESFQGTSPWDVFSMIRAGKLQLGGYVPGLVIFLLLLVGMVVEERFFCRFLCPMGAIFSLLPVLPFFSLRRERSSCISGCSACTRKCPSGIALSESGIGVDGDCFACQKCIEVCPKQNIHVGVSSSIKGNEWWFTLIKTAVLAGLLIWHGI